MSSRPIGNKKRLAPVTAVQRMLFAKSGNECAFPGCTRHLVDQQGKFVGQICHIETTSRGGERYNPKMPFEELRSFDNLILMCHEHLVATEDVQTYTVEALREIKRNHEERTDKMSEEDAMRLFNWIAERLPKNMKKMYSMQNLSNQERRILQTFSLVSAVEIEKDVYRWIGCEEKDLKKLAEQGWLEMSRSGYALPTLVKDMLLLDRDSFPRDLTDRFISYMVKDPDSYLAADLQPETVLSRFQLAEGILKYERDTAEYAEALNNLGYACEDQGEYAKAEEYYLKALSACRKVLGEDHPDTGTVCNNLGLFYQSRGNYPKAEEYNLKALRIREKELGEDHPDTGSTCSNLFLLYQAQKKYQLAETYLLRDLEIQKKVQGEDHPDVGTIYNNLAGLYQMQGEHAKAEEYYRKALNIYVEKCGEDHPMTKIIVENLIILLASRQ